MEEQGYENNNSTVGGEQQSMENSTAEILWKESRAHGIFPRKSFLRSLR